jgi:hypothetical protein
MGQQIFDLKTEIRRAAVQRIKRGVVLLVIGIVVGGLLLYVLASLNYSGIIAVAPFLIAPYGAWEILSGLASYIDPTGVVKKAVRRIDSTGVEKKVTRRIRKEGPEEEHVRKRITEEPELGKLYGVDGYELRITSGGFAFISSYGSWTISYDELDRVTLTGGAANREMRLKSKKFTKLKVFNNDKVFSLDKKQVERLRKILPAIPALAPKLKIELDTRALRSLRP